MKKINNKYLSYGLTAFAVIASAIILYFIILRFKDILLAIGNFLKIFKSLLYGIIIAFLLTQLYNYFDRLFNKWLNKKVKNVKKISKIISLTLSIVILLLLLFLIIYVLIPKLIISILGIINSWSTYTNSIETWLMNVLSVSPNLKEAILNMVNESSSDILTWLTTAIVPNLENVSNTVTTGLTDMYIFLKDFVIGFVFSIYILVNKNKFIAGIKKITYRILGIKKTNELMKTTRFCYRIFIGFLKGKSLASIIVGFVCYISMIILDIPYALLISFIIAVTNIIPFFGPFIGWIPSAILIALISPLKALYFSIMILLLQQIDGNYLSPKLMGDSIGLSAFWVLLAIVIFGELFGIIGMILGVPIFAVIYQFITRNVDYKLKENGLPVDIEEYENLKYIDETTKKVIKKKTS